MTGGDESGGLISVIHRVIVGIDRPDDQEAAVLEADYHVVNDDNATHNDTHDDKDAVEANVTSGLDGGTN